MKEQMIYDLGEIKVALGYIREHYCFEVERILLPRRLARNLLGLGDIAGWEECCVGAELYGIPATVEDRERFALVVQLKELK